MVLWILTDYPLFLCLAKDAVRSSGWRSPFARSRCKVFLINSLNELNAPPQIPSPFKLYPAVIPPETFVAFLWPAIQFHCNLDLGLFFG